MDQEAKSTLDILFDESRIEEKVESKELLSKVGKAHYQVVEANERRRYRV